MKKKLMIFSGIFMLMAGISFAAINSVYLRYYNKDSKTYVYDVKIGGSTSKVEFGSSRTASVTIQGGGSSAVIKTNCGDVTVKDGDNIEIKDGCITVK
ncbi:MAG: hypothetical protein ACJ75J_14975 [Cytophagaceae bacterium]